MREFGLQLKNNKKKNYLKLENLNRVKSEYKIYSLNLQLFWLYNFGYQIKYSRYSKETKTNT